MKISAIALFVFLAVFRVEGQGNSRTSCLCQGNGVQFIKPKLIKGVQHYLPSASCPQIEIIVTTTANKKVCLNPESPLAKTLLQRISRSQTKAVSTSMSPPTVYSSSTPPNINQTVL